MLAAIENKFNDAVLLECLKRYGFVLEETTFIGGFDSFVYECKRDGRRFILKITHRMRRTDNDLRGEIDWLTFLGRSGVSVSMPIPSNSGNLLEVLGDGDSYFIAIAYQRAPGDLPTDKDWDSPFFEAWGRMLGRLHALSHNYEVTDPAWRRNEWYDEEHLQLDAYIPNDQSAVLRKSQALLAAIKQLPATQEHYGLIHGDLHFLNVHLDEGRITMFDFDDSTYHYFIYDLAVVLFYAYWRPLQASRDRTAFIRHFFQHFLKGYNQEHAFRTEWLTWLPDFLRLRHLVQYIVFLQYAKGRVLKEDEREIQIHMQKVIEEDWPIIDFDFSTLASDGIVDIGE